MEEKRRGRRKKVVEKNYDVLIQQCNQEILTIQNKMDELKVQMKEKKIEIKKLEKEKAIYDEMKAEQEKSERIRELAEMIDKSEYTLDEIKELLNHKNWNYKLHLNHKMLINRVG